MTTTPGRLRWRKSSYSGGGGDCVEVAHDADRVHVRNSNAPDAGTLYVVGADGTGLREITPPSSVQAFSLAAWSPDGQWIAFIDADGALRLVHPDGTELHKVPFGLDARIDAATGGATWSPDGAWIAFSARAVGADNPDIYAVRSDETGLRQVTNTPSVAEFTDDWVS